MLLYAFNTKIRNVIDILDCFLVKISQQDYVKFCRIMCHVFREHTLKSIYLILLVKSF